MSKPNLFLDLDQTIISSEPTETYNVKKHKEVLQKFKHYYMKPYYIVFVRPYTEEFLDFIFKNFNVSVWTAASKSYALFIIEKVILNGKKRKLDYILFDYHVKVSEHYKDRTKSLSLLSDIFKLEGYNMSNTFIIDDYDEVFNTQRQNAIWIPVFNIKNDNRNSDTALKRLIPLLERLKENYEKTKSVEGSIEEINFGTYYLFGHSFQQ